MDNTHLVQWNGIIFHDINYPSKPSLRISLYEQSLLGILTKYRSSTKVLLLWKPVAFIWVLCLSYPFWHLTVLSWWYCREPNWNKLYKCDLLHVYKLRRICTLSSFSSNGCVFSYPMIQICTSGHLNY